MTQSASSKGHGGKQFVEQDLIEKAVRGNDWRTCLLYTSPSPRDAHESRMPSSA